ncbi:MAG: CARDB domain-containing protein, partial [Vicinamibacteria bacterium]
VPDGRALSLTWTASSGPLGIFEYAVFRSTSTGGPYVEVSRSPWLGMVDDDLSNGVTYFYVVRALDPRGEASPDSNEASGTPTDGAAPDAPVLLQPTTAGAPITLTTARTDLSGRAEPSVRVSVFRGTDLVAEVDAASSLVDTRSFPVSENGVRATDGMRLADVGAGGVRLWDFASGTSRDFDFDAGSEIAHGAAFSPDGGRLAIAAGSSLHVLDLSSGAAASFALSGESGSPEWVSEGSVAVVAERNIVLLDLSSGASEEIYRGFFFEPPRELRLSREGSRLAFVQGGILFVLELSSRSSALAAEAIGFTWTTDVEIVLADFDGLHLRDVALGTTVPIPGTEGMRFPARLGPGEIIALSPENEVVLVGTGISALGPLPVPEFDIELLTATGDFRVLVVDREESRAKLFSLPGRFEARGVALLSGPNELTALAEDAGGNVSPLAAPIEIVFDDSLLPDLVLTELLVVPAVPASGDVASLSVTVRNAGLSEAPSSFVQLVLGDGLGNRFQVGSAALPAVSAGGSVVVARGWDTSGLSGAFHLFAEADPLGTLDERDEANNSLSKPVTVVAERGIGLSIAAALPSYGPREDVEIRVEAVNGGASSDVTLETVIEDGIGNRFATIDQRSVPLQFGEATAYTLFWNTGGSLAGLAGLAGTYRARVFASGASAADDFEVRRVLDVRASVTAGRPAYVQGESAAFFAELVDEGSNAPLRDLTLHFSVGSEFDATSTVSYLPMGAATEIGVVWPRIDGPPGPRTVTLRVLEGAQEIAAATGSFEVRPATEVELSGRLALESSEVPAGGEIVARFEIENRGVLPAAGEAARLEILDPATGLSSLLEQVTFDVAPGDVFTGEVLLDTNGLGLGPRSVILAAPSPLASAPVTLFAVPEPPSVNDPAEGTSTVQPLRLSVNNGTNPNGPNGPNGERPTYEFEIYLDPSLRFLLGASTGIREGTNTTAWAAPLELQENERYFWRARVRGRFAVSDWMPPASFFADTVNDAPSAPSLSSPAPSTEVFSRTPALSVMNSFDPEGAALTYTFEVFAGFGLGEPVFSVASVPEGDGETSVVVAALLDEDQTYFWRARASDSELDSDWTAAASFRVNTANHPPTRPEAIRPRDEDAGTLQPELTARAGFDPEGEAVLHRLEIDRSPSFDGAALQIVDGIAPTGDEVRWTPPSPLLENQIYFWRARATDGASASDWSERATFRVDTANEPPSIPRPDSPIGGALVETATPTLVLVNAADPEADSLLYDFEVYEADSLVARIESLREGEGRTAWAVSPRLEEDRTYRFRARAKDGALASDWSSLESFLVNAVNGAPSAPSRSAPAEGGVVASLPVTLEVVNAIDEDGDALTYRFEVYEDPDLTVLVEASGDVLESTGRTLWEMTAALEENHPYYWRARASDGSLEGAWMPTARFRFSLESEAPTPPVLVSPAEGETVAETRPVFTIENASDPDGDLVRYVFEITTESDALVLRSP